MHNTAKPGEVAYKWNRQTNIPMYYFMKAKF